MKNQKYSKIGIECTYRDEINEETKCIWVASILATGYAVISLDDEFGRCSDDRITIIENKQNIEILNY